MIRARSIHPSSSRHLRGISICDFRYLQGITSRLIGVMEGEQLDGKKKVRNDRLIAVAELNHAYKDWKKLRDLPDQFITELEAFFVNYHGLEGKKYKLLGCKEAKTALELVKKAQKAASRTR